jgi:hypothetical protein
MLGWPALLTGLIWAVRKWDAAGVAASAMKDDTTETRRMVMETLGGVTTIRDNHLAHIREEIQRQTPILTTMDKSLAIIAERNRPS